MPSVDSTSALGQSTAARKTGANGQLGQNEFLTLMITQLKNQDPLKPLDPNEFLGQLAQFSVVTSIQNMEGAIADLSGSLRSSQMLGAAALIGHDVLAPSTSAVLGAEGSVSGAADVPPGTTDMQVVVRDESGQLVRRFSVAPEAGLTEFTWDGLTDGGEPAPAGRYEFEVLAVVGGENVSLDPLLAGEIHSVTLDPASQKLILNTSLGAVALSDARRIQ